MTVHRTDDDLDLMLAFDGEADGNEIDIHDRSAVVKLQALGEVSELVRGYIELEADAADERLTGLWDNVERRIRANGQSAPAHAPRSQAAEPSGLWGRLAAWFEEHRGHFVTGAVSAAAVALIMLVSLPRQESKTTTVVVPAAPNQTVRTTNELAEGTPPEIESLEVFQGSGTIVTMPNDDGTSTSVIWLAPEDVEEKVEDPI